MEIDSGYAVRELEAGYERLQDRGDADDPPLPARLVRGAVDSVVDPVAVHPTVIVDTGAARPDPVEAIEAALTDRLPDLPPTDDSMLARLRAWQPERGGEHAD